MLLVTNLKVAVSFRFYLEVLLFQFEDGAVGSNFKTGLLVLI